jgi:glycerol kinase
MQFQTDILGVAVERLETIETASLGAAYLAGVAVGSWKEQSSIIKQTVISAPAWKRKNGKSCAPVGL